MRTTRLTTRSATAIVATLLAGTAAAVATTAPVGAATAPVAGASARAPGGTSFSTKGSLFGVTATSAGNAWAVGSTSTGAMILHWNGTSWAETRGPAHSGLNAVAATSASNAWAVGGTLTPGRSNRSLIMHWNGSSWAAVPNPSPASSDLTAVSATSADNAWAVGSHGSSSPRILILHWNGKTWTRVPVPAIHPAGARLGATLNGVTATSTGSAWAAGAIVSSTSGDAGGLILHWTGTSWKQVSGGRVTASSSVLNGIAATPGHSVWTVGCACEGGPDGGVTGRSAGGSWKRVAIPVPALEGGLNAVTTAPAGGAWATGVYCAAHCSSGGTVKVLILRWTGSAWAKAASTAPRGSFLESVTAASATSAWAVGNTDTGRTLILHWNGHAWS